MASKENDHLISGQVRVGGFKYNNLDQNKRRKINIVFADPKPINFKEIPMATNVRLHEKKVINPTQPQLDQVCEASRIVDEEYCHSNVVKPIQKRKRRKRKNKMLFGRDLVIEPEPNPTKDTLAVSLSTDSSKSSNDNAIFQPGTVTCELFQNKKYQGTGLPRKSNSPSHIAISEESNERVKLTPRSKIITLSSDSSPSNAVVAFKKNTIAEQHSNVGGSGETENSEVNACTSNDEISPSSGQIVSLSSSDSSLHVLPNVNFEPMVTSTCANQETRMRQASQQDGLSPIGKKCLEAIPIIFNQYLGISMETCLEVLMNNNFNILTTITELQDLVTEPVMESDMD